MFLRCRSIPLAALCSVMFKYLRPPRKDTNTLLRQLFPVWTALISPLMGMAAVVAGPPRLWEPVRLASRSNSAYRGAWARQARRVVVICSVICRICIGKLLKLRNLPRSCSTHTFPQVQAEDGQYLYVWRPPPTIPEGLIPGPALDFGFGSDVGSGP